MFHYYRRLIELRHRYEIIVYGAFEPLLEEDESVYAYRRTLGNETLTVLCNWTDRVAPCALPVDGEELISNYPSHREGVLFPYEARVIYKRGD